MSDPLYYIQCTSHFAYDYILWWRKESKGYTYNLADAGLYTAEQAKSIVGCRGEEVAWPQEEVERCSNPAVSIEALRTAKVKPSLKPAPKPIKRQRKLKSEKCSHCGRFFSMENCPPDFNLCKECAR
jgi:hypothetical protein